MPVSHAKISKPLGLLAVVAAALPAVSQADTMDYSFAELAYVDSEFGSQGGDGLSLRGSLPVNETFFVYAGYWDVGYDFIDITMSEEIQNILGNNGGVPVAAEHLRLALVDDGGLRSGPPVTGIEETAASQRHARGSSSPRPTRCGCRSRPRSPSSWPPGGWAVYTTQ